MTLILSGTDGVSDIDGSAATPAIRGTDANTGIFFPAADTIGFAEGGAEVARFDSSGNFGVGTSTFNSVRTVIQGSQTGGAPQTSGTAQTYGLLRLQGTTFTSVLDFGTNGGNYNWIQATDNSNLATNYNLAINPNGGNLLVGTTSSGGERLYVTQSAVSSTAYFLNNNGTATNQYGIVVNLNGDPNNTNHMVQCVGNATNRAVIRANGGLANYSANNVNLSDRREKTNFAPASDYLAKICAIPVQTFNYIDQNLEEDDGLTLGVVAQDVQAVAPELVIESNWGTIEEPRMRLSIYQTDLQYALMKCIQEQQALITALTERIEALEAK